MEAGTFVFVVAHRGCGEWGWGKRRASQSFPVPRECLGGLFRPGEYRRVSTCVNEFTGSFAGSVVSADALHAE